MKTAYQLMTSICLLVLMTATCNAVDIQNVAPPATPATPPKDMGMKHEMGGGMGMRHGMGMGMGMGMHHGMMANMTDEQKEQHMRSMQEHMLKMHDLSNQILAEKDATKKEALKKQQIDLMKSHHAEMMERHHQMHKGQPTNN